MCFVNSTILLRHSVVLLFTEAENSTNECQLNTDHWPAQQTSAFPEKVKLFYLVIWEHLVEGVKGGPNK